MRYFSSLGPRPSPLHARFDLQGRNNAVNTGLTDHVMGMRRGPSLELRRKLGASYSKETRNGGPCNVSACDGPRGHTHVHHRRSVTLALRHIFSIFRIFLVTMSTLCPPSRDQSAQALPGFTALFPPPQIKTRT